MYPLTILKVQILYFLVKNAGHRPCVMIDGRYQQIATEHSLEATFQKLITRFRREI